MRYSNLRPECAVAAADGASFLIQSCLLSLIPSIPVKCL